MSTCQRGSCWSPPRPVPNPLPPGLPTLSFVGPVRGLPPPRHNCFPRFPRRLFRYLAKDLSIRLHRQLGPKCAPPRAAARADVDRLTSCGTDEPSAHGGCPDTSAHEPPPGALSLRLACKAPPPLRIGCGGEPPQLAVPAQTQDGPAPAGANGKDRPSDDFAAGGDVPLGVALDLQCDSD
jgi:hypothetical protein